MALRFFAAGSMQLVIADNMNISQPSVSVILPRVCDAIIAHLHDYVRMPQTVEECRKNCAEFHSVANFPFVIGAIDCTHIKIQSPGGNDAELFRNRKGYFSFNVQTISDQNMRILDIVARWPGSTHDQTIFINSLIHQRFDRGDFGNYILIGDSGYANTRFLATPFTAANPNLAADRATRFYNRSIVTTRNVVERKYGLWKRRFTAMAYGLRLKKENIQKVIVACAVLHNIAIEEREPEPLADERIDRVIRALDVEFDLNQQQQDPVDQRGRRRGIVTARERIMRIFNQRIRMAE